MKIKILSIVACILFFNTLIVFANNDKNYYKVIKIIDGDTFYVDFNNNGKAEATEKVRINGIDAFEVKNSARLQKQAKQYNLTEAEALSLGYLGRGFAKKNLLNKYVKVEYSAKTKVDRYNRPLVSIYYNCNKKGQCTKSYEQEVLKEGLALVYSGSNLKKALKPYENIEKIKENAEKTKNLNLVVLNKRNNKYHKINCQYGTTVSQQEIIKKPIFKYHCANCCIDEKRKEVQNKKYKPYKKSVKPNAQEENMQLFFLSPLKQKEPVNKCVTSACKALLYNIDNAKESIDFAIYGIKEQDTIFTALLQAQKRGIKIRWVTDLTEKEQNIYSDTYRLMKYIPYYNTDFEAQKKEAERTANFKFPQTAIMHNKFFIFDNKKVFTGSTNISSTCLTGYNSNVAVLINSEKIASIYKEEFEQMYKGKFHNEKAPVKDNEDIRFNNLVISVYFSPTNHATLNQIIPLIKSAKEYIYIPAFYLTRNDIIQELISAKNRGLDIKIIVDETSTKGKYVNVDYIKNNGIDIKIENWQGKMHMKSFIIDDNTLVIGSMNFTKQGEFINDENCLVIKNSPILTMAYKKHFLELWNSI